MMDLQRVNEYMSQVEESEKKVLPHGKRLKAGFKPKRLKSFLKNAAWTLRK